MGWRDRFIGTQASYVGVPFVIEEIDMVFGRDLTLVDNKTGGFAAAFGQASASDDAVQDQGILPRQLDILCSFSGDNYIENRDLLIRAIERGGIGSLILPNHEPISVRAGRAVNRFSNSSGGHEKILVTFIQSKDEVLPVFVINHEKVADEAALTTYGAIKEAFNMIASTFEDVAAKTTEMVEAVSDTIETVMAGGEGEPLNSILDSLQTISTNARTLIQSPQTLALEITDTIDAITFAFTNPIDAFNAQVKLFQDYGFGLPFFSISTPSDQDLRDNRTSMVQIVQNAALAGAGRSLAKADFDSLDDALLAKQTFDIAVAAQQVANGDEQGYDDVFFSLSALQAAIAEHINSQENLPSNVTAIFNDQIPSLVITEDLYGDADRADEVVARNFIRNPLFCNTEMSVLSL